MLVRYFWWCLRSFLSKDYTYTLENYKKKKLSSTSFISFWLYPSYLFPQKGILTISGTPWLGRSLKFQSWYIVLYPLKKMLIIKDYHWQSFQKIEKYCPGAIAKAPVPDKINRLRLDLNLKFAFSFFLASSIRRRIARVKTPAGCWSSKFYNDTMISFSTKKDRRIKQDFTKKFSQSILLILIIL